MEGSEGHQRKSLVSFNIIFSHLRATNNTLCIGDVYKLYTKHRNIIGHLFLLNNDIPNPLGALQDMWSGHLQQITEKKWRNLQRFQPLISKCSDSGPKAN